MNMADLITCSRIILSFIMLLFPVCSSPFYFCYLLAGFSDMIDGTVARKCETASDFGTRLDTIADVVFTAVSAYKFLPVLKIPVGIWIWTGVIAMIKVISIISGYTLNKQFVSIHTIANKLTGLLLFLFPLSAAVIDIRFSIIAVCMAATIAAIQEGHLIRSGKQP